MEKQDRQAFAKNYSSNLAKWGLITNTVGIILGFLPVIVLYVVYGYRPNMAAFGIGFAAIAAAIAVGWFADPISCVPVIGVAGTMMGFLSGNVNGVRLPSAVIAQDVAGTEPGTPENDVVTILGMCASVVVSTVILTVCAIGGTALLGALPETVRSSFNYMLPCVLAAVFIQLAIKQLRVVPFALAVALGVRFGVKLGLLPAILNSFVAVICIVVCVGVGLLFYKSDVKKEQANK